MALSKIQNLANWLKKRAKLDEIVDELNTRENKLTLLEQSAGFYNPINP